MKKKERQRFAVESFRKMGCGPLCTCPPFLAGDWVRMNGDEGWIEVGGAYEN